jgi:hypothetical protein
LFVNASVLDESGAPSRAPILLNFESPSQAEHHSTRQAPSEAEAGLCGQSEEVTAYKRHLAANVERILGQIEPDMDIPSCADFAHLEVECWPGCHGEYPDEMELIDIELRGRAWICCALDRALTPSKRVSHPRTALKNES